MVWSCTLDLEQPIVLTAHQTIPIDWAAEREQRDRERNAAPHLSAPTAPPAPPAPPITTALAAPAAAPVTTAPTAPVDEDLRNEAMMTIAIAWTKLMHANDVAAANELERTAKQVFGEDVFQEVMNVAVANV